MNNVQIFGLVMLTLTVVTLIGGLILIKRSQVRQSESAVRDAK